MDADAQSGLLIGLTQTLAAQYGEGGIRANLIAPTVIKTAMTKDFWDYPFFLNPVLYKADKQTPSVFNDILATTSPNSTAVIRVDYANTVNSSDGFLVSLRAIDYQGPETYCDGTGNCATRNVIPSTLAGAIYRFGDSRITCRLPSFMKTSKN